ncbi:hypothetical protein B0H14DRAFT_3865509 [Mycena olivaceomarginata]|nr:hypothetical protein B0H14DRAFT_3865509 [Mycena olivaceomarginata]
MHLDNLPEGESRPFTTPATTTRVEGTSSSLLKSATHTATTGLSRSPEDAPDPRPHSHLNPPPHHPPIPALLRFMRSGYRPTPYNNLLAVQRPDDISYMSYRHLLSHRIRTTLNRWSVAGWSNARRARLLLKPSSSGRASATARLPCTRACNLKRIMCVRLSLSLATDPTFSVFAKSGGSLSGGCAVPYVELAAAGERCASLSCVPARCVFPFLPSSTMS